MNNHQKYRDTTEQRMKLIASLLARGPDKDTLQRIKDQISVQNRTVAGHHGSFGNQTGVRTPIFTPIEWKIRNIPPAGG